MSGKGSAEPSSVLSGPGEERLVTVSVQHPVNRAWHPGGITTGGKSHIQNVCSAPRGGRAWHLVLGMTKEIADQIQHFQGFLQAARDRRIYVEKKYELTFLGLCCQETN